MTRRTIRTAATCSALALATALAAAPAAAQSFQGTPTVTFGVANVTTGPSTTDVQVDSTSAVIDWAPDDTAISNGTPIVFQPAGTTATFHNNPTSQNDFALLNRIVPVDASRPILFDGTVISRLQTAAGQVPGGTVFFYSPGGIIVGSNAVFDVGNLGLTSAPPMVDGNGFWYVNNAVQFGQAASNSFVQIQQGATISAIAQGSYVAAFSPRIIQSGTINVNGQVALVAGEAGTITFSPDGLFDIQVTIGTDETFAIDHDGTTGGPASAGAGDNHRVYMVAIPKNQAIQIAIGRGSQIGFDVAGAADIVGNAVVLSAGHNVTGGQVDTAVAGGTTADISINDSNSFGTGTGIDFTSGVSGYASGHVFVDVFRQTNFASDALLQANDGVQVAVSQLTNEPAGALSVGGNLTISGQRRAPVASDPVDAGDAILFTFLGGTIDIGGDLTVSAVTTVDGNGDGTAQGGFAGIQLSDAGVLNVGGSVHVDASAYADFDPSAPTAIGGNATIGLSGASSLTTGGVVRVLSYGIAGTNNGMGGNGADGIGGFAGISINSGSSADVLELNVAADGVGGADTGSGAGNGAGGSANITIDGTGSTLSVQQANQIGNGNLGELDMLSAEGFGGATNGLGSTVGGTGTGGSASLVVTGGGAAALPTSLTGPLIRLIARGTGGQALADGTTGGDAFGGNISIFLDNGTLTGERILPSSFAQGGNAGPSANGTIDGGNGFGGTRHITLLNGSVFTGSVVGGAASGAGGEGSATGRGGDGSGGQANLTVDNSTLNVSAGGFLTFTQNGGGGGAIGGNGSGGQAFAQIINGGVVNVAAGGTFFVGANAFAGGTLTPATDVGGNATGGQALLLVNSGGAINGSGNVEVSSIGFGGSAVQGGHGMGGSATLDVVNGSVSVSNITVNADGSGGSFFSTGTPIAGVVAGNGTGGQAVINLNGATIAAGAIDVSAEGDGGDVDAAGFSGVTGGTGTGGIAAIQALGGTNAVTASDLRIDGSGNGGTLVDGAGTGGSGVGGLAYLRSGASLTVNAPVAVVADGDGGSAQAGGTGGSGTSGAADVTTHNGSMTVNGSLVVSASSNGGDGTVGGAATFGAAPNQVVLNADNGTLLVNGQTFLTANAHGGTGTTGNGGAANAGSVFATAQNGGTLDFADDANADAFAFGGSTVDGNGGAAAGGRAVYLAQGGGSIVLSNVEGNLTADSQATGGSASGLGNGGNATAGSAIVQVIGGIIDIAGNLGIASDATGGDGVNGGHAFGSTDQLAMVNAFLWAQGGGTITVDGQTGLGSFLEGGSGRAGGTGGNATGGTVVVLAQSNTAGTNGSQITLDDLFAFNVATGGQGGSSTGTGGAGGTGTAGAVSILGDAGNGRLVINGSTNAESVGEGGLGGDGATGGTGGNGFGGHVQVGTRSGPATSDNTGSATFADLTIVSAGFGGGGGVGSSGVGGNGGDAGINGGAVLLVRGSTVTVGGTANLIAQAFGGNGGSGSSGSGAGGDGLIGTTGGVVLEVTNRFQIPGDRGTLIANNIFGQAFAAGGSGSTPGAALVGDQPASVNFSGADGNIGTLSFSVSGGTVTGTVPSLINLTGATVNVNDFGFGTPGDLVLALDGAVLNTGQFFLQAREIVLPATAPVAPGTVNVANGMGIFVDSGASIRTYANFVTDFGVDFSVDGDFQVGDFTANGDIFLESRNGSVSTGALTGDTIGLTALQNIAVGAIDANGDIVLVAQNGGVSTGALDGTNVDVSGAQNLVLGDIAASGDIVLHTQSGSVTTGALNGTNTTISSAQDLTLGDTSSSGNLFLESLNGSLTTGNLSGANIGLFAANNVSAQNIATAGGIEVEAGGTATVGGAWTGQSVQIISNDIDLPGSVQAGSIVLFSTNFGGAFIGDGLPGTSGYRLSSAEFSRLQGNEILIAGVNNQEGSSGVSMTIGNLAISGNQLGSNGFVDFATGNLETETPGGRIRIDGQITATNMGPDNYIEFFADSVEINAATGGIASTNSSGGLGGIVLIEADHIHVASDEILMRLRSDPLYEGRADDLNRAGAIDRPDGVLRALGLEFYPGRTLYIQNTGTATNPAGFYTTIENSDIEPPGFENPEAPDVDVIINGRFQTGSGDATGRDAFDLAVANAESFEGFTETSQLNGCVFSSGICGGVAPSEPAAPPTNAAEITALTEDQAEEEPFDTEDEDEAEQAASAPIAPPVVLINSRPLNADVDIDDPVSGSGNPALIGASVTDDAQGDQP